MKLGEKSFTLLETVIALGLIVTVVAGVASTQGVSLNLTEYARKSSRAMWIAKAMMAEIEYSSKFFSLKEMKLDATYAEREVSRSLCRRDDPDCDYTYSIRIEDFKFPFIDLFLGGGKKEGSEDESTSTGGMDGFKDMIKQRIKQILGDEILKIAQIEVFWPEGSQRGQVNLALLLGNQLPLDEFIENLPPPAKTGDKKDEKKIEVTNPTAGAQTRSRPPPAREEGDDAVEDSR